MTFGQSNQLLCHFIACLRFCVYGGQCTDFQLCSELLQDKIKSTRRNVTELWHFVHKTNNKPKWFKPQTVFNYFYLEFPNEKLTNGISTLQFTLDLNFITFWNFPEFVSNFVVFRDRTGNGLKWTGRFGSFRYEFRREMWTVDAGHFHLFLDRISSISDDWLIFYDFISDFTGRDRGSWNAPMALLYDRISPNLLDRLSWNFHDLHSRALCPSSINLKIKT